MSELAIRGGKPIRDNLWGKHPVISKEDVLSVFHPFCNNCFSGFRAGSPSGGPMVKEFENKMKDMINAQHAVAFDTWSNGLISILLAIGVEYGDEVILPAYTMSACAAAVLSCGALPVFVDIDERNYCLSPEDIEKKISNKTKAIMVVHLFGMPADMDKIIEIAKKRNIFVIEDAAQAPLATYKGKPCATIGDVGGFSFTESKHVMCGEGGIAVTNNEKIANGLIYVRNHGEVTSLPGCSQSYAENMYSKSLIGFNFRLTELAAALGNTQLDRLPNEINKRRTFAEWLNGELKDCPFLYFPKVDYDFEHSYYVYVLRYKQINNIKRNTICAALKAEGVSFLEGYCQPIYRQKIYTKNKHWVIRNLGGHIDYSECGCDNTDRINGNELMVSLDVRSPNTIDDMKDIRDAFLKILDHIDEL